MRQHKYWFSVGLVLTTLAFAGCKQEGDSNISAKVAGKLGSPNDKVAADPNSPTGPLSKEDSLKATSRDNEADPSVERCYQDLCTAESEKYTYQTIFGEAARSTDDQHDYYQKNMVAAVQKYVDINLANKAQMLAAIEAAEPQLPDIKLSETELRFVKAMIIFEKPELMPEGLHNTLLAKTIEKDYLKAQLQNLSNRPEAAFKILYPKLELTEAIKKESQHILSLRDNFKKALKMNIISLDEDLFQRALKGATLSATEMKYLLTRGFNLKSYEDLALGEFHELVDSFTLSDRDLIKIYQESKLKETLKPVHTALEEYGYCEGRFYQSINLYPRQADVDAFKALVPEVVKAVSSLVPANDKAQEKLKDLKIGYPKMAGDIVKDWQVELRSAIAEEQSTVDLAKGLTQSGLKTWILLNATMNNKNRQTACDKIISLEISDMTIVGYGQLNVSWFSVRYPMYGVGILAHEIGHIVKEQSESFETQKNCIVNRQALDVQNKKDLSSFNLSEEFADMISAKVVKQLEARLQFKPQNFGCYFASMENSKKELIKLSSAGHSSGLFRALTLANIEGKKIPASCEDLAAAQNSKVLNRCE